MQECGRGPRRAKRDVEVLWKPFVGFNVEERRTEASSGEMSLCGDCMYDTAVDNFMWCPATL